MCGIAGILNSGRKEENKALIERMNAVLKHRGPDDQGIYVNDSIGLGMTRLSIIDLSSNGHQPMSNEYGNIWIVFNGEIYNHNCIRKELESKGHRYKSNSDTESIIHLYEEYGVDCLIRLNGMFAFAIWDSVQKRLFIARDRLGIKPLYYTVINNQFCFASEIKAILCHPEIKKEIDFVAMDQYFTYGVVYPPKTIYKNIFALEPGHLLLIKGSSIEKQRYWNLYEKLYGNKKNVDNHIREAEYIDEITLRLKNSVRLMLMSDVPLGVFLSGGVDSGLITALMSEMSSKPVKTFSVGFNDGDTDLNELKYCRIVSKRYATEHYEFIQTPNINDILPEIINHFDEPFGNPTSIPMYHISGLARDYVKVALSGVGGDELFGGYPRHLASQWFKYQQIIPEAIRKTGLSIATKLQKSPTPYSILDRARRFLSLKIGTDAFMYGGLRSLFNPDQKYQLYGGSTRQELYERDKNSSHLIEEVFNNSFGRNLVEKALFTDIMTYLPNDLLAYSDRMSMAVSLEVRVPFCDHEFVEFAMSIPSICKIRRFQLKYLLKKVALRFLPKEVIYRKKQGFSVPVGYWIKNDLKPLINKFLSKDLIEKQGYFNYSSVYQMLNYHNSGRTNYASQIWALLVFQMWHEQHIN